MSTRERDGLKILWVKAGPLLPANTGGRIRTHQMLRAMAKQHEITFLALRDPSQPDDEDVAGADYARHREFIPWSDAVRGSWAFKRGFLLNLLGSTKPYVLTKYESPALAARIRALDASGDFDLLVCDFLTPALSFDAKGTRTRSVIFQHNIESLIWERMSSQRASLPVQWLLRLQFHRMEKWETRLCHRFHGTITVSPDDSKLACQRYGLRNLLGDVPAGVDAAYFAPVRTSAPATTPTIGFLGSMDWLPNIEGVEWFIKEVWPLLKQRHPDLRFHIIGRNPPVSLRILTKHDPGIELTGTVEDVRPHLAKCHAMVVPLLTGGGTRIKILEMMAAHRVVVSTTVGAEGLGMAHGGQLLLADDPEAFARRTSEALTDHSLAESIAGRALQRVEAEHSWQRAARTFVELAMKR